MDHRNERFLHVKVKMTSGEAEAKGRLLGQECRGLQLDEASAKESAAEWKSKINARKTKIDALTEIVNSGVDQRPVKVHDEYDYVESVVRTVRTDTGQIEDSRPMLTSEHEAEKKRRQGNLKFDEEKKTKEAQELVDKSAAKIRDQDARARAAAEKKPEVVDAEIVNEEASTPPATNVRLLTSGKKPRGEGRKRKEIDGPRTPPADFRENT